jgi:hypothetical protein
VKVFRLHQGQYVEYFWKLRHKEQALCALAVNGPNRLEIGYVVASELGHVKKCHECNRGRGSAKKQSAALLWSEGVWRESKPPPR